MVIETSRPIARVAKELGINEGTLGNWVSAYRREHAGEEPPLTVNERARLRELERETREQRMEVSRSGFYEWRNAPESATAKRRGIIALCVQKSFDESDGTYGYRRVRTDLVWGVPA